ncbi:MAG: hypothetical protein ACE37F_07385 [Nannocystaceae bacterium]|nr:hypothetical protein [bacterium]
MYVVFAVATLLAADPAGDFYHPYHQAPVGPRLLDMSTAKPLPERAAPEPGLRFEDLDSIQTDAPLAVPERRVDSDVSLPPAWTQIGDGVVPTPVAQGFEVDPVPQGAFEDIPGNKYPRKHTLYLNFVGANLMPVSNDISAEDLSALAGDAPYPAFTQGESTAVAIAQAVSNDLAAYGVRVVYLERPDPMVPYTMEMMGGSWQDTSLDSPAGGVAPSADCGALNQRHVVFTFTEGAAGASRLANTASQEAGHAWGLDHTLNCGSVMSYCGGGDQSFSDACDPLCEEQCQGANTIGCRLQHEMFCGKGSDAQNEQAELLFLFGDDTPDIDPPTIVIDSPADGSAFAPGASVDFRAVLDDDFGGVGWRNIVVKDGETFLDEIDYGKENLDEDGRIAINLTGLDLGHYEITVIAADHADHVTEATVEFDVVEDPSETSAGDGSTGDGGAEGSSGEGGGTGDDDATGPGAESGDAGSDGGDTDDGAAGADGGGGDSGCSVGARGSGSFGASLLLLAGLGLRRRRGA